MLRAVVNRDLQPGREFARHGGNPGQLPGEFLQAAAQAQHPPGTRHPDRANRDLVGRIGADQEHLFGSVGFIETHRDRGPRIPDPLVAAHALRPVDVPQCDVIKPRETIGAHGAQVADLNGTLAFTAERAHGRQMPGRHNRPARRDGGGVIQDPPVMLADALPHLRRHLLGCLARGSAAHVALPQIRHRADHGVAEIQNRLPRILRRGPDHADFERPEQVPGRVESQSGVVVAADHEHLGGGAGDAGEKLVVLGERLLGRVGAVENVPGDDEEVGPELRDLFKQPGEETGVFRGPVLVDEARPEVPVGGVENQRHGAGVAGERLGCGPSWRFMRWSAVG